MKFIPSFFTDFTKPPSAVGVQPNLSPVVSKNPRKLSGFGLSFKPKSL
jgi:hypothetical protein